MFVQEFGDRGTGDGARVYACAGLIDCLFAMVDDRVSGGWQILIWAEEDADYLIGIHVQGVGV